MAHGSAAHTGGDQRLVIDGLRDARRVCREVVFARHGGGRGGWRRMLSHDGGRTGCRAPPWLACAGGGVERRLVGADEDQAGAARIRTLWRSPGAASAVAATLLWSAVPPRRQR